MNQPGSNEVQSIRKIITASSVGTLIEWYDFYILEVLPPVIASQFFRKQILRPLCFPLWPHLQRVLLYVLLAPWYLED